jgi:hypothetical protein
MIKPLLKRKLWLEILDTDNLLEKGSEKKTQKINSESI